MTENSPARQNLLRQFNLVQAVMVQRLRITSCLVLLACIAVGSVRAKAQLKPTHADVLIIIVPTAQGSGELGASRAIMSVTFPNQLETHKAVERINRMLNNGGWRAASVEVSSRKLKVNGKSGIQTSVSVVLDNAILVRDGGFWLQPIIAAFQDLNLVEILYLLPPDASFIGLRSYKSAALDVNLIQAGNPYRYAIRINDHANALPILPLTQQLQQADGSESAGNKAGIVFKQILALAMIAGIVVFIFLFGYQKYRAHVEQAQR